MIRFAVDVVVVIVAVDADLNLDVDVAVDICLDLDVDADVNVDPFSADPSSSLFISFPANPKPAPNPIAKQTRDAQRPMRQYTFFLLFKALKTLLLCKFCLGLKINLCKYFYNYISRLRFKVLRVTFVTFELLHIYWGIKGFRTYFGVMHIYWGIKGFQT